jgi:hypothetical protein
MQRIRRAFPFGHIEPGVFPVSESDIEQAIAENASGPKKASGDQGSMEQHPLPDQIAAAKFLSAKSGVNSAGLGLRRVKMEPPGAV